MFSTQTTFALTGLMDEFGVPHIQLRRAITRELLKPLRKMIFNLMEDTEEKKKVVDEVRYTHSKKKLQSTIVNKKGDKVI